MDQPSSTESNALTLRIRFKSASLDEFIGRYAVDVSPGGIFIRTRQPVDVGTSLQFDFMLADGTSLLAGLGTVAWVRENDPTRTNNVPGMGLRFDKLTPDSQMTHQRILAEKARKEGKPQGTPYPPTAFVMGPARPSPSPEAARPAAEPAAIPDSLGKQEVSPANFAKTLPAPAAALAARMQHSIEESGEFDGGGKTEISDKPIEDLMREAEAAQRAGLGTEFAPRSLLDDSKTDAHDLDAADLPPAPEEVAVSDSQAYATEAPVPPPSSSTSGERELAASRSFASLLDLGETSENFSNEPTASHEQPVDAMSADSTSGVPVEVATSEKTEEVSLAAGRLGDDIAEPLDLGTATGDEEIERVPSLAEIEAATVASKPKRSAGLAIGGIVLAAAAAFAAVYLLQTKPWEKTGDVEGPVAVVKKIPAAPVAPAPAPAPKPAPSPEPAAVPAEKPAVAAAPAAKPAEEPAAKKPAAAEEKAAAAPSEKPAAAPAPAEKPAAPPAEKPVAAPAEKAQEAAAEKPAEKPAAGKPSPTAGKPSSAVAAKPAVKAGGKPSPEAPAAEKPAAEKAAAGAEVEEPHRLAFRSSPIGAEVLIDGEYFARTPCERRILDPKKTIAVTVRREGYEPFEHIVGPSDNWVKKGSERVLSISVTLKKVAKPAVPEGAAPAAPASGGEAKVAPKPAPDEPEPVKE